MAAGQTLLEVMTRHHLRPPAEGLLHLGESIHSYGVLDDEKVFCVGYYTPKPDADGRLELGDVHVCLYEKASRQWRARSFHPQPHDFRGGSILEVHATPHFVLLTLHHSQVLVLTRRLAVYDTLPALQVMGSFLDDTVVYQEYQPQFAPTHYASIRLYFPHTRQHRQIYPMKPYQAVRLRHLARVKAEYARRGEEWFASPNHHMDPDRCDSFASRGMAIHDETDSLAFVVNFCNAETWPPDQRKLPEPEFTKAVYVYKNVRSEKEVVYREMLKEEVEKTYGTLALEKLLTAERLAELFSSHRSR